MGSTDKAKGATVISITPLLLIAKAIAIGSLREHRILPAISADATVDFELDSTIVKATTGDGEPPITGAPAEVVVRRLLIACSEVALEHAGETTTVIV